MYNENGSDTGLNESRVEPVDVTRVQRMARARRKTPPLLSALSRMLFQRQANHIAEVIEPTRTYRVSGRHRRKTSFIELFIKSTARVQNAHYRADNSKNGLYRVQRRMRRQMEGRELLAGKLQSVVPLITVAAALVITIFVLFTPPYVGMEDNGDFARVMYGEGLYDLAENVDSRFDGYFIKEYGIMQYYNEYSSTVYSSQLMFIKPAIVLDKLFTGNDAIFDLRFLAAITLVYFLIVLYYLVDYLINRLTLVGSLLIAAMCIVVFVDTGYTAYFNSFYAEPIAYVSLLGCVTSVLLYAEERYNRYALLCGFLLCGMILTFSKQQYAPVGVLLGLLGLFICLRASGRLFKWLVAVSSCLLAVTGVVTYLLISTDFTNINLYHAMTRGVLLTSDNPPETLKEFGIDSRYELLDGTIYFDKYPVIDPEDQLLLEEFYSHYNVFSIVKYYAAHPDAFVDMLKLAARSAYQNRPSIGNYERGNSYGPNTIAQTFSLHSALKSAMTPRTLGYIIIWIVVVLVVLRKQRLRQIIVADVILIGLSQIVVSIIGAGDADLAKHIFLYNAAYDLVNVILLAYIVRFFDERHQVKKQREKEKEDIEEAVYKNT